MAILHLDSQVLSGASLSDAEVAVRELDGVDRTVVLIELSGGRTLTVAGGPNKFVVECAENETISLVCDRPDGGRRRR